MKNLTVYLIISYIFAVASFAQQTSIYIAPDGNDNNSGTISKPFATLEKARDKVRNLKESNYFNPDGIKVYLRAGKYYLKKTFHLEAIDSGWNTAPVIYTAYQNEKVELIGGASLQISDFKKVTDHEILKRLPEKSKQKVLQANLKSKGIINFGKMPLYGHSAIFLNAKTKFKSGTTAPELFYNDMEMTLARWPNQGFTTIEEVIEIGSIPRHWMNDMKGSTNRGNLFSYVPPEQRKDPPQGFTIKISQPQIKRWKHADDIWMFGYWYWDWSDQSVKVKSIDPKTSQITTVHPSAYGVRKDQRFYVYNLLEELDCPGEWYLDRSTAILYLYPPDNDPNAQIRISLLEETMIKINQASNIIIKNLNFSNSRNNAITIKNGFNNLIENCQISKLGGNAVSIVGGQKNGITKCEISDMASGGIKLIGGDRQTLTPANHYATKNHIRNYARIAKTYTPAVSISGVGNIVSGNKIHNGPHAGIIFSGNDHLIEYNEIFDVINESQDMGAIYAGRDLTARGNTIQYNYIHSIKGVQRGHANTIYGIYFDDMLSGTTVFGNVFYDVPTGVQINGGRDNIIKNNIFVKIQHAPIMISTTGFLEMCITHWKTHCYGLKQTNPRESYTADAPGKPVNWNKPPYTKYPNLANILQDQPKHPKYNIASRNVFYKSPDLFIWIRGDVDFDKSTVLAYSEIEHNLLTETDPGFVDLKNRNFQLKNNSQVYKKIPDFEQIPFNKMGLKD